MSYFGYDFDVDDSISEVNALFDSTQSMDLDSWAARFEPLQPDDLLAIHSSEPNGGPVSSYVHKSPTPEPESISPHVETSHKPLDLKPLPSELKYVHPVIVASDLTSVQEAQLVNVIQ